MNASRGIANYELFQMGETEVNNIFDLSVLNPYPKYHCWGMGSVELARGLIKGALKPGEFDKLGMHPNDLGVAGASENKLQYLATGSLASVPTGYLVNFDNTPLWNTYLLSGPWGNEFAIKTGNDKYVPWGVFPDSERTEVAVKNALLEKFNDQVSYFYKVGIKDIPGFQGMAWTVNMATFAQKIFNLRTGQTP